MIFGNFKICYMQKKILLLGNPTHSFQNSLVDLLIRHGELPLGTKPKDCLICSKEQPSYMQPAEKRKKHGASIVIFYGTSLVFVNECATHMLSEQKPGEKFVFISVKNNHLGVPQKNKNVNYYSSEDCMRDDFARIFPNESAVTIAAQGVSLVA